MRGLRFDALLALAYGAHDFGILAASVRVGLLGDELLEVVRQAQAERGYFAGLFHGASHVLVTLLRTSTVLVLARY